MTQATFAPTKTALRSTRSGVTRLAFACCRAESRWRRSGKHALEGCAIRWLAVRWSHELDRQVEQRTEPSDHIVARHVLATAQLDVQSVAEVGERVAGDDRVDRRQPEEKVVVFTARVRVDAERPRSGTVEVSFAFARGQPGEILALPAAHAIGVDAELLHPVLPGVCGRRVQREAEPAGVALVVRRGQDDGGRALAQLVGNGEWVEQHEVVAELDRVRGDEFGPPLLLVPVGMRRLPMPDTRAKLTHGRQCYGWRARRDKSHRSFRHRLGEPTTGSADIRERSPSPAPGWASN